MVIPLTAPLGIYNVYTRLSQSTVLFLFLNAFNKMHFMRTTQTTYFQITDCRLFGPEYSSLFVVVLLFRHLIGQDSFLLFFCTHHYLQVG